MTENDDRPSLPVGPDGNPRQRRETPDSGAWMKVAGLGIELAGNTLAATAIGIGIDWYAGSQRPIGTAIGALTGFAFGMLRFIQRASRSNPG